MSTTISKGRIFRVTITVDDERLAQMRKSPELAQAALRKAADAWHTKILPEHFKPSAHMKYGYAKRTLAYLKESRKAGKPDLVMSGSLRDNLKAVASFRIASKTVIELKMSARVLNFAPNMGQNDQDLYVKHKNKPAYPNLKREIKRITLDERELIAKVAADALEVAFGPTGEKTLTRTGAAA